MDHFWWVIVGSLVVSVINGQELYANAPGDCDTIQEIFTLDEYLQALICLDMRTACNAYWSDSSEKEACIDCADSIEVIIYTNSTVTVSVSARLLRYTNDGVNVPRAVFLNQTKIGSWGTLSEVINCGEEKPIPTTVPEIATTLEVTTVITEEASTIHTETTIITTMPTMEATTMPSYGDCSKVERLITLDNGSYPITQLVSNACQKAFAGNINELVPCTNLASDINKQLLNNISNGELVKVADLIRAYASGGAPRADFVQNALIGDWGTLQQFIACTEAWTTEMQTTAEAITTAIPEEPTTAEEMTTAEVTEAATTAMPEVQTTQEETTTVEVTEAATTTVPETTPSYADCTKLDSLITKTNGVFPLVSYLSQACKDYYGVADFDNWLACLEVGVEIESVLNKTSSNTGKLLEVAEIARNYAKQQADFVQNKVFGGWGTLQQFIVCCEALPTEMTTTAEATTMPEAETSPSYGDCSKVDSLITKENGTFPLIPSVTKACNAHFGLDITAMLSCIQMSAAMEKELAKSITNVEKLTNLVNIIKDYAKGSPNAADFVQNVVFGGWGTLQQFIECCEASIPSTPAYGECSKVEGLITKDNGTFPLVTSAVQACNGQFGMNFDESIPCIQMSLAIETEISKNSTNAEKLVNVADIITNYAKRNDKAAEFVQKKLIGDWGTLQQFIACCQAYTTEMATTIEATTMPETSPSYGDCSKVDSLITKDNGTFPLIPSVTKACSGHFASDITAMLSCIQMNAAMENELNKSGTNAEKLTNLVNIIKDYAKGSPNAADFVQNVLIGGWGTLQQFIECCEASIPTTPAYGDCSKVESLIKKGNETSPLAAAVVDACKVHFMQNLPDMLPCIQMSVAIDGELSSNSANLDKLPNVVNIAKDYAKGSPNAADFVQNVVFGGWGTLQQFIECFEQQTTIAHGETTTEEATTAEEASTISEETTTAAPEETTTAAPEETTTAAIEETTTAAPEETTTAAPEETTTAAPEETTTAALEETTTAAPEETTTAAPEETTTAALEETTTAAPKPTGDCDGREPLIKSRYDPVMVATLYRECNKTFGTGQAAERNQCITMTNRIAKQINGSSTTDKAMERVVEQILLYATTPVRQDFAKNTILTDGNNETWGTLQQFADCQGAIKLFVVNGVKSTDWTCGFAGADGGSVIPVGSKACASGTQYYYKGGSEINWAKIVNNSLDIGQLNCASSGHQIYACTQPSKCYTGTGSDMTAIFAPYCSLGTCAAYMLLNSNNETQSFVEATEGITITVGDQIASGAWKDLPGNYLKIEAVGCGVYTTDVKCD